MKLHPTKLFKFFSKIGKTRKLIAELNGLSTDAETLRSDAKILFINSKYDLFHSVFCFFMGCHLARRGAEVHILCDDGLLSHYDNDNHSSLDFFYARKNSFWGRRKNFIKTRLFLFLASIQNKSRVRFIYYSDFHASLTQQEKDRVVEHVGARNHLPPHVEASHRRYFGGRPYDVDSASHRLFAQLTLENYIINQKVSERLKGQYALVLCLDGTYTTPGTLYEELTLVPGTEGVVYQHDGFKDRSLYFGKMPAAIGTRPEDWLHFQKNTPVSTKLGEQFLRDRTSSASEPFTASEQEFVNLIQERKRELKAKKIVCLFPNLSWDCAIQQRNTIFQSMDHWIAATIELAIKKNYILILREHPQSKADYTPKDSVISLLKDVYPDLASSSNLILIDGLSALNSYRLARQVADVNLIYNGTLAIELAYLKVPVLLCGNSPYSGTGIAKEPKSIEEFERYIEDPRVIGETELVCLYAEFHFFNNAFYCPIMPRKAHSFGEEEKFWLDWDCGVNQLAKDFTRTIDHILSKAGRVHE